MVVQFSSTMCTLLFLLLAVTSCFWLVFFKAQILLFIALPVGNQQITFIVLLLLCFLFRSIQVLYLIWKQTTIEIFLIDWEKSTLTSTTNSSVSVWRTYFIANEWSKLQTLRKLNPTLILMITLLFLEVIGLKNLAEHDPNSHITVTTERYSPSHNIILRFSLGVILYLTFAVLVVSVYSIIY